MRSIYDTNIQKIPGFTPGQLSFYLYKNKDKLELRFDSVLSFIETYSRQNRWTHDLYEKCVMLFINRITKENSSIDLHISKIPKLESRANNLRFIQFIEAQYIQICNNRYENTHYRQYNNLEHNIISYGLIEDIVFKIENFNLYSELDSFWKNIKEWTEHISILDNKQINELKCYQYGYDIYHLNSKSKIKTLFNDYSIEQQIGLSFLFLSKNKNGIHNFHNIFPNKGVRTKKEIYYKLQKYALDNASIKMLYFNGTFQKTSTENIFFKLALSKKSLFENYLTLVIDILSDNDLEHNTSYRNIGMTSGNSMNMRYYSFKFLLFCIDHNITEIKDTLLSHKFEINTFLDNLKWYSHLIHHEDNEADNDSVLRKLNTILFPDSIPLFSETESFKYNMCLLNTKEITNIQLEF